MYCDTYYRGPTAGGIAALPLCNRFLLNFQLVFDKLDRVWRLSTVNEILWLPGNLGFPKLFSKLDGCRCVLTWTKYLVGHNSLITRLTELVQQRTGNIGTVIGLNWGSFTM